jgi:uroporphyrinogen decarboxylase
MTHRQRIHAALRREQTDRVPLDLGSTLATTLTAGAHERLRRYLGLPGASPAAVFSRRSGTVIPDEALLKYFDVDARPLILGAPERRPDREISETAFVDEWGITWSRPHGGHYINTAGPFYGLEEPSPRDVERHDWPDPDDPGRFRGLRDRARALYEQTDYAVVLGLGVGPVHQCQFLRGYGEWLVDLIAHPAFAEALLDRVVEIWVAIARRALEEAAEFVDLVMFGDDVGTQKGPLVRPELYRRVIQPRHRRMIEAVKAFGKPVLFHSCGSVYALIPALIDAGVDILNPIQVSAAHMDTARLKAEFGRDLVFWGAVDNQGVLPKGTPEAVRCEVRRRVADLGPGGGYVLAAAHNIQQDVPPENVVAMFDEARRLRL